jgi:hypothetical protein
MGMADMEDKEEDKEGMEDKEAGNQVEVVAASSRYLSDNHNQQYLMRLYSHCLHSNLGVQDPQNK